MKSRLEYLASLTDLKELEAYASMGKRHHRDGDELLRTLGVVGLWAFLFEENYEKCGVFEVLENAFDARDEARRKEGALFDLRDITPAQLLEREGYRIAASTGHIIPVDMASDATKGHRDHKRLTRDFDGTPRLWDVASTNSGGSAPAADSDMPSEGALSREMDFSDSDSAEPVPDDVPATNVPPAPPADGIRRKPGKAYTKRRVAFPSEEGIDSLGGKANIKQARADAVREAEEAGDGNEVVDDDDDGVNEAAALEGMPIHRDGRPPMGWLDPVPEDARPCVDKHGTPLRVGDRVVLGFTMDGDRGRRIEQLAYYGYSGEDRQLTLLKWGQDYGWVAHHPPHTPSEEEDIHEADRVAVSRCVRVKNPPPSTPSSPSEESEESEEEEESGDDDWIVPGTPTYEGGPPVYDASPTAKENPPKKNKRGVDAAELCSALQDVVNQQQVKRPRGFVYVQETPPPSPEREA